MKVMLDECITKKCAHVVIDYLSLLWPPIEAHFLIDFMGKQGARDCEWPLLCNPSEEWMVITQDCGKAPPRIHAKGPPLHLILPRRKITAFFLSGGTIVNATGFERARIIISKLPEMLERARNGPSGIRYRVRRSGAGFVVDEWPLTAPSSAPLPPPSGQSAASS